MHSSLSPIRWFVMTGWRASICLQPFVQLQPFDQTRLECGPCCLQASSPPCVSNTVGLWFRVWVQAFTSCFLGQTRLNFGSLLCTSTSLHPCLKLVWITVPCLRTRISSPTLCFECVWIVDLSLCTRIRHQPCSNTFDCGGLFVYPPARTKMR